MKALSIIGIVLASLFLVTAFSSYDVDELTGALMLSTFYLLGFSIVALVKTKKLDK
jgi:hypothetical protein